MVHLPVVYWYSVARDSKKKAKTYYDGRAQIQNKDACTPVPVREGTVLTSCGLPSLTLCKPTTVCTLCTGPLIVSVTGPSLTQHTLVLVNHYLLFHIMRVFLITHVRFLTFFSPEIKQKILVHVDPLHWGNTTTARIASLPGFGSRMDNRSVLYTFRCSFGRSAKDGVWPIPIGAEGPDLIRSTPYWSIKQDCKEGCRSTPLTIYIATLNTFLRVSIYTYYCSIQCLQVCRSLAIYIARLQYR